MTLTQSEPKIVYKIAPEPQAIFFRRRHHPSRPRLAKIRLGRPARRWGRGRPKPDQRVGPRLAGTGWGQIHDRQVSAKRSSRKERDRNPKPAAEPASQPMNTEKTNSESTPPAITSFSPARSGASSPRK